MSRQRLIGLLIAALVVLSGALYLSTQRNQSREVNGAPLLPSLAGELDTVTSLSVLKGSATPSVTVHKQGEQWTVAERANYPADVAKLRKLLLALGEAKIREEKTSDPANYSVIGVEDPTKSGSTGAQIEVIAKDGKHDLIVGKPATQGSFVRRAGEKASYSVEPAISLEAEPRYWLDARLLDVSAEKIQSVDFKPATGPGYTLRRVSETTPVAAGDKAANTQTAAATPAPATPPVPAPSKFVLEGVPGGRQAADAQTLAPPPNFLSSLGNEDVAAAADIDFSKASICTVTLSDGSTITLSGTAVGEKRWIQVTAPKDAALSAKTNGRAFEIASYRYDNIFRPLEQMLVPKPVPPSAKPAAAPPPTGAKKPPAAPKP